MLILWQDNLQEKSNWLQKKGCWVSKISQFPIPPVGGGKVGKFGKRPFCVHFYHIWESWESWESGEHAAKKFTGDLQEILLGGGFLVQLNGMREPCSCDLDIFRLEFDAEELAGFEDGGFAG